MRAATITDGTIAHLGILASGISVHGRRGVTFAASALFPFAVEQPEGHGERTHLFEPGRELV
jgi:hypothetical protein